MSFQLFVGGIGGPELVIVFFLVILLFGANKLPRLARASGEAMGEFQKGREQIESDIRDATRTPTPAAADDESGGDVDAVTGPDTTAGVDTDLAVETEPDAHSV
jgi:sec-independent protein translocase protein TatA